MKPASIFAVVALLLSACGGMPAAFQSKGEQALAAGLSQYEAGDYAEATKSLQGAIAAGLSPGNEVEAHKHLAFIYCTSNRQSLCRDEFRKALEIDPQMQLSAAEAGHPSWGPVFRAVKAARR